MEKIIFNKNVVNNKCRHCNGDKIYSTTVSKLVEKEVREIKSPTKKYNWEVFDPVIEIQRYNKLLKCCSCNRILGRIINESTR